MRISTSTDVLKKNQLAWLGDYILLEGSCYRKCNDHLSSNENTLSTGPCNNEYVPNAYAHCNNCNENEHNSPIWNEDGPPIAAGPDPIIIMKPAKDWDYGKARKNDLERKIERKKRWEWKKKNVSTASTLLLNAYNHSLKNAQRPTGVAVLDSTLISSIPPEFTFIAGVLVHKVFHGWDLTASDAKIHLPMQFSTERAGKMGKLYRTRVRVLR